MILNFLIKGELHCAHVSKRLCTAVRSLTFLNFLCQGSLDTIRNDFKIQRSTDFMDFLANLFMESNGSLLFCQNCFNVNFSLTELILFISESILATIKIKSDMFEKFKSIHWFDINNRQKRATLQQFKKQRKFQVHFYENGITFKTHNGTETMPIRTSPFPILNLY